MFISHAIIKKKIMKWPKQSFCVLISQFLNIEGKKPLHRVRVKFKGNVQLYKGSLNMAISAISCLQNRYISLFVLIIYVTPFVWIIMLWGDEQYVLLIYREVQLFKISKLKFLYLQTQRFLKLLLIQYL